MAGFFDTLFGGGAEKEAADKNRQLYQNYLTNGLGYLDNAYGTSKDALNTAYGSLSGLGQKYGAATSLGLDALGVNGADAAAKAWQSYTSGPQYTTDVNAGLDAINRRRAAGGMLNSGNADIDAQTLGQTLENKNSNQWLSNLLGFTNPELSATTGAAGVQQSLSDLAQNDATNRIGLQGNYTSGNASANNMQAAGEAAGAKNALSGALGLAQLGMSAFGGGGGFGSILGGGAGKLTGTDLALNNRLFPGYGTG